MHEAGGHAPRPPRVSSLLLAALLTSTTPAWAVPLTALQPAPDEPFTITGTRVLPLKLAQKAAGKPPKGFKALASWAPGAAKRIVAAYREQGYRYARAWVRADERKQRVRIHVDEGRMRIMFTGAGSISAFLMKVDLNLPGNVFHGPTLRTALHELKRKHSLINIYYRVKEPNEVHITPLGNAVPQRVLQIYIVRREVFGWGFDVSLSSSWGVLPAVSFRHGGVMWPDDRFDAKLEVAFPFRRYLFDKDPKLTWVHGCLNARYRLPRWFHRHLGLRPSNRVTASRYERVDISLLSFYEMRNTSVAELVGYVGPLELGLGGGLDAVWIENVEQMEQPEGAPPAPDETSMVRSLWRAFVHLKPSAEVLRSDQRSYVNLTLDLRTETYDTVTVDLHLSSQLFVLLGRHRLIARLRGAVLAGEVPFFDERQLAGSYQRVYFGDRYWIHKALQLETAYRVNLFWDWFEVGIFHDLSLFGDRSDQQGVEPALANAFGPSIHLLLFDTFTLAMYSGFGFAPVGFDHTFSFTLEKIF